MKLIIAIIQDEDASEVISHLNEAKFQVTRLSTKGGFLRAGNTTIMTGVVPVICLFHGFAWNPHGSAGF